MWNVKCETSWDHEQLTLLSSQLLYCAVPRACGSDEWVECCDKRAAGTFKRFAMYSYQEFIDFTLLAQGIFSLCFLVSALSVSGYDSTGYLAVFTAFFFAAFTGTSHYGISYKLTGVFYGAILGGSFILIFVALQSAIFWGHYGTCSTVNTPLPTMAPTMQPSTNTPTIQPSTNIPTMQPSTNTPTLLQLNFLLMEQSVNIQHRRLGEIICISTGGMKAVCTFSVFLMLSYIFFLVVLFRFKDDILAKLSSNEQYTSVPSSEYSHSSRFKADEMNLWVESRVVMRRSYFP